MVAGMVDADKETVLRCKTGGGGRNYRSDVMTRTLPLCLITMEKLEKREGCLRDICSTETHAPRSSDDRRHLTFAGLTALAETVHQGRRLTISMHNQPVTGAQT
jgi:hypothetical protein